MWEIFEFHRNTPGNFREDGFPGAPILGGPGWNTEPL